MGHKSDGNVFGGAASPPAAYSLRNKSRRVHVPVKSKQRTVYILMCAPQIPRSFPSFGTCYARWFAILDLPTLYPFTSCNAWRWRWISASKRAKDLLRYREMGIMHPLRWFLHLDFEVILQQIIFSFREKKKRELSIRYCHYCGRKSDNWHWQPMCTNVNESSGKVKIDI